MSIYIEVYIGESKGTHVHARLIKVARKQSREEIKALSCRPSDQLLAP
jgi:hypothetical protein